MTIGKAIPKNGTTVYASDSAAQRKAEPLMIDAVAEAIGVPLAKRRIDFDSGAWCEVDGVSGDGRVIVEAFARQRPARSSRGAAADRDRADGPR